VRRWLSVHPIVPAVVYFVVAVVWIAVSDRVALRLFPEPDAFAAAQTIKGWVFVAASASLIAITSLRQHRVRAVLEREKHAAHDRALGAYQRLLDEVATLDGRVDAARDRDVGDAMRHFLTELGAWDELRLWRIDGDQRACVYAAGAEGDRSAAAAATPTRPDDAVARALATGREAVVDEPDGVRGQGLRRTVVAVPVGVEDGVLGVVELVGTEPRAFLGETALALRMAASLLGLLWHNQDLWTREAHGRRVLEASEARLAHRLDQISSLHRIDRAITSGQPLSATLELAVREVVQRLGVDIACVLVRDDAERLLRPAASFGFRAAASARATVPVGEGVAGAMAYGEAHVSIDGRDPLSARFVRARLIEDEGVEAYDSVPLNAHGELYGVLEVFHRAPAVRGGDWAADLEAFGDQIAIAIDQATTASALRATNRQLVEAYDTTIEGWAAALDLRDEETQGHSRRVTDLTVRLAERLGVPPAEREHIRRGALLHDIGKMGVPDAILSKPGPLDEDEWAVMKQHPGLAHQLLSGTPFLRDALDIPYAHHERWDGSGYPLGLAGDAIPLAARIFAVVDVYDALSSDRPYRAAWPRDRVLAHLRAESGRHFDPAVVRAFLELVGA
jgi:putative nucleotidyltransferase with HDIG domain